MPAPDPAREGLTFSSLDSPLFDGADATKGDLVDHLDACADRILPELAGRPLSVIRVHRGSDAFMQKNVPKHAPAFVRTVALWAETSHREVHYALCDDRRTLLWFANQRAVEYHPTLVRADDLGLAGVVKSSGAKGVHVFVPVHGVANEEAAAATRAVAARAAALDPAVATTEFLKEDRAGKVFVDATRVGGATVVAAWSPRVRPGAPVSFPLHWDDLDGFAPTDVNVRNARDRADDAGPWLADLASQEVPEVLVEEGRSIAPGRVAAMHEGKRRKARARGADAGPGDRPDAGTDADTEVDAP